MFKNRFIYYFIMISLLMITGVKSYALEIIYPKQNPVNINSSTTFFIGNTTPDSTLTINDTPVKVWENGSFVQVVPLVEGENIFTIKSQCKEQTDKIDFTIIKKIPVKTEIQSTEIQEFPTDKYLYATAIKDDIPLRIAPDDNAPRISHLTKGTVLILDGMKDKYYRVNLGKKESLWVSGDNVVIATNIEGRILATVSTVKFESDKLFDYLKLDLNMPIAYKISEIDNNLELNIYGLKYSKDLIDAIVAQSIFTNAKIKSTSNDNFVIEFPSDRKLWGYDCYYEGNKLIFKKRKTPEINVKKPLDKITIAIDAGHGGPDSGAIGPTGEKEKNITLDIAKKLETELKNAGATVVLTRTDDTAVDLFDRVKTAKINNALISISIHANALPDGLDPMIKHGTSSYYYHKEAKDLAQTLKYQIVTDLGTKDDGCAKGSFVLTRSTAPLSVLIEIAYMIHPEEYQLLLNENFRQNAAVSIRKGLENYLINSINQPTAQN